METFSIIRTSISECFYVVGIGCLKLQVGYFFRPNVLRRPRIPSSLCLGNPAHCILVTEVFPFQRCVDEGECRGSQPSSLSIGNQSRIDGYDPISTQPRVAHEEYGCKLAGERYRGVILGHQDVCPHPKKVRTERPVTEFHWATRSSHQTTALYVTSFSRKPGVGSPMSTRYFGWGTQIVYSPLVNHTS